MDLIFQPWPWYVAGPLIAATMLLITYFGRSFGLSENLRTLCTIGGGKKIEYFNIDWKAQKWNLVFLIGTVIGGFITSQFLTSEYAIALNPQTISDLKDLGFHNAHRGFLPQEIFDVKQLMSFKGISILLIGGILVGFGTRYAGGCTSGHAISGLSNLQLPSLIAVIGFFVGGLVMTHFIFPIIFN